MTSIPERPELVPLLLSKGLMTEEQYEEAKARGADESNMSEILQSLGVITEDQIHFMISAETGLPYLHLSPDMADEELVKKFPAGALHQKGIVPLLEDPEELSVAMTDPWDEEAVEMIGRVCEKPLNISLAARGNVSEVLRELIGRESAEAEAAAIAVEDSTGIALVYQQLLGAASSHATEIHLDSTSTGLEIRYRVNGALEQRAAMPAAMALPVFARMRVLASVDPYGKDAYLQRGIKTQLGGQDMELEISWTHTASGGSGLIRLGRSVPAAAAAADLMGDSSLEDLLVRDLRKPCGLVVLAAAPGGPDPRTRARPFLDSVGKGGTKVVALASEANPAEVPGILSLPDEGEPFADRLALATRLAPDVLYVPVVADSDELRRVLEAAVEGPAVLLGFRHSRAADLMAHLFSAGLLHRALAASVLTSVTAVRITHRLCDACREELQPDSEEAAAVRASMEQLHQSALEGKALYRRRGCETCGDKGWTENLPLAEYLGFNARARELFRSGRLGEAIRAAHRTCRDLGLLEAGDIGVEEVS